MFYQHLKDLNPDIPIMDRKAETAIQGEGGYHIEAGTVLGQEMKSHLHFAIVTCRKGTDATQKIDGMYIPNNEVIKMFGLDL